MSGCSASCAQPQIADIGFRGEVAHRDQYLSEAVDIGVGGSLGPDAAFIDWVAGRLPVDEVPAALARVLERYHGERRPDEPFYVWARRTPGDEVRRTLEGTIAGARDAGAPDAADAVGPADRADLASAHAARSRGTTGGTP